jgi:hypothetical protein
LVPVAGGRMWGNGEGGWIWCNYCVHICVNRKIRPVETIPGMGGGQDKEWLSKVKYDIIDIL